MLLLLVPTLTAIGEIQTNVRMVWIITQWTCLNRPAVSRRITNVEYGPTLKFFPSIPASLASDSR